MFFKMAGTPRNPRHIMIVYTHSCSLRQNEKEVRVMIYAKVGSVTTASRLAKKLTAHGDSQAAVVHTPPEMARGGCSYSVKTGMQSPLVVKKIAAESDIEIRGFYREITENGRKTYHAIS